MKSLMDRADQPFRSSTIFSARARKASSTPRPDLALVSVTLQFFCRAPPFTIPDLPYVGEI